MIIHIWVHFSFRHANFQQRERLPNNLCQNLISGKWWIRCYWEWHIQEILRLSYFIVFILTFSELSYWTCPEPTEYLRYFLLFLYCFLVNQLNHCQPEIRWTLYKGVMQFPWSIHYSTKTKTWSIFLALFGGYIVLLRCFFRWNSANNWYFEEPLHLIYKVFSL